MKLNLVSPHQWTDGGTEVLILKCCNEDGTTYNGFQWPLTVGATVEPQSWNPEPLCGNGLHGWPWGLGIGGGKEPNWHGTWIVFGAIPADVVDLGDKVKTRHATVRFVGNWHDALMFLLNGQMRLIAHRASSSAASSGDRSSAASSGDSSSAASSG